LDVETVAAELRSALLRSSRRLRRETGRDDMSPSQIAVLTALLEGPQTLGQLADLEQVQAPWMTRTVTTLERLDMVTRTRDPADGRQVLVSLSGKGRRHLEKTRKLRTEWLAELVAEASPQEREVLASAAQILLRLTAN
jgi:DNA-binding MarR family transcriptional regulator